MDNFKNVLLYKDNRLSNDIFEILRELDNCYIVRKTDTLSSEEPQIMTISKEEKEMYLYSAEEFLQTSEYIGKSVYTPGMSDLESYIFESFILIYKNDTNELYFDTVQERFFISNALFEKDEIYISEIQYPEYSFKKGYGKK